VASAAAIWFPRLEIPDGVDDSKKVSEAKRPAIAEAIRKTAIVAVAHATVAEIDELGILRATHIAMTRAWTLLNPPRDALIIIDGNHVPRGIKGNAVSMPGADAQCPTVAAASIIAKVERDQIVHDLAGDDDIYGWKANKGYGTRAHLAAIDRYGISIHHRRSFAPIRQMVAAG